MKPWYKVVTPREISARVGPSMGDLAVSTARRLNVIKVETSAVFNLSTQFGGGKTHALTLLCHMAKGGPHASAWKGVSSVLR